MQKQPLEIKAFPLIILDLALHIVPWIRYLGFITRGKKGPLDTMVDLYACESKRNLIHILTVNKPLFSGAVAGEQVIKIQSSLRL
jgi:hypothetical protein